MGTVHVAVAIPGQLQHRRFLFGGSRQTIRELAANFALDLLRRVLKGAA
mgnify:CR=1 FL=1